jgi:hypothetical protein
VRVITVSAAVLVCTRPLSPLFAFLILAALVDLATPRAVWRLVRFRRDVRRSALALAVIGAISTGWILFAHSLWLLRAGPGVSPGASEASVIGEAFGQTHLWLQQMVGVLGWDDTFLPTWTYRIWLLVVVALLVAALWSRRRRGLVVIGTLVVLSLVLPVLLSLANARHVGIVWEGRYTLPLAAGIPITAAALGGSAPDPPRAWVRCTLLLALALASLLGYLETLRRYAVGIYGPIDFLKGPWRPIEGWPLALGGYVCASGLLLVLLWRLCSMPTSPLQQSPAARPFDADTHAFVRGSP